MFPRKVFSGSVIHTKIKHTIQILVDLFTLLKYEIVFLFENASQAKIIDAVFVKFSTFIAYISHLQIENDFLDRRPIK